MFFASGRHRVWALLDVRFGVRGFNTVLLPLLTMRESKLSSHSAAAMVFWEERLKQFKMQGQYTKGLVSLLV